MDREEIERVRDAHPIEEVVGRYVHLRCTGRRYVGFCLGAYLAGEGPGFRLLPGDTDQYITSKKASVRHDGDAVVTVTWGDEARPLYFSVRTKEFDPKLGSRKKLILYPTPDDEYILYAQMTLRQVGIDAVNQYPIGGETLSAVILAACLAAAEHNLDDAEGIHERQFQQLLPLAIAADQERSSPTSLGPDAPRSEQGSVSSYWLRSARLGTVSLDGTEL